jgi:SAM-dependent methyltransferase
MNQIDLVLPIDAYRHDEGFCWVVELPSAVAPGDDIDNHHKSDLQLWEGDKLLGPAHAVHSRIRKLGGGLYSHWGRKLFLSSAVADEPVASGLAYRIRASKAEEGGVSGNQTATNSPVNDAIFPRLAAIKSALHPTNKYGSTDLLYNPEGDHQRRIRMLEAKVEYLLDEIYTSKSQLRRIAAVSNETKEDKAYQLRTFDFQWANLPYHDMFLSNPEWRGKAPQDLCRRLGVEPSWIAGKRVLDCGCGPGRHAWAFAHLGAQITAFDMSDSGLAEAKRECANYPTTIIEKRNILEPLPYSTDFDIVWSYGVIHCTGDTYGALSNIARHVRPGGLIYFMVYPEPERTNFDSYRYYHEVYAIRALTDHLDLRQKAEVMKLIQGDRWALSWFDAISSKINDLYTFEEASKLLLSLGFVDVKRTMPEEHSLNVVATRAG